MNTGSKCRAKRAGRENAGKKGRMEMAASAERKKRLSDRAVFQWAVIAVGVMFLAYGIDCFVEPNKLVTGGATGLGILGQRLCQQFFGFTYPLWISNIVINAPLFVMAWIVLGKDFVWRSLLSTIGLSAALYAASFLPRIPTGIYPTGNDMLLGAVFGGAMDGLGVGLALRNRSTTGGSDIAASLVHHYHKHIPLSTILLIMNAVLIAAGGFIYGPRNAMYAIICVFVSSRVLNVVLEGVSYTKAAFIISDAAENIGQRVMNEMNRGVTSLNGMGMYTKTPKNVIMCVVSAKEIVKLKSIAKETDPRAFLIITDAREVMGEGFRERSV
jgi:uncharacterized membrane-anchored protein YitT (DUF2179 family)